MIGYLLAYLIMFSTFHTAWQFVLVSVLSFVLSPEEERDRIMFAFASAFVLFVFFVSEPLASYSQDVYPPASEAFRFLDPIKQWMQARAESLGESGKQMYRSLLMGEIDYKSEFSSLIKEHGIIHLFVVSGFHFGLLFSMLSHLLSRWMKLPYKFSLLCIFLVSTLYFLLLPGNFGTTRAYLSIILSISAFFLGRSSDPENALFTISLFWLIAVPTDLYRLGFQLTFVATYLVILSSKIPFIKHQESVIFQNLLLSLLVSIGVSGFLVMKGKSVAILSFLVMAISTPLISLLMFLFLLYTFLPQGVFFLDLYVAKGINFLSDLYGNFLSLTSGMGDLQLSFSVNQAILMELSIVFLFFSRKLLSYGWKPKRIVILYSSLLFCFIL